MRVRKRANSILVDKVLVDRMLPCGNGLAPTLILSSKHFFAHLKEFASQHSNVEFNGEIFQKRFTPDTEH